MAADAAKLLDELMGRDRNANPTEPKREVRWDDHDVSLGNNFMSLKCGKIDCIMENFMPNVEAQTLL